MRMIRLDHESGRSCAFSTCHHRHHFFARLFPPSLTASSSAASTRVQIPIGSRTSRLYLPTRRAGRMAREIFLEVLNTDAVLLPRIVGLGAVDEDELAFAADDLGGSDSTRYSAGARWARTPPGAGQSCHRLGHAVVAARSSLGAPCGRRPSVHVGARNRSRAADGRHGHARRSMDRARWPGAGRPRPILAAHAAVSEHRQRYVAADPRRPWQDRTGDTT